MRSGARAGEERAGGCNLIPKAKEPRKIIGNSMKAYSYIEQYYFQRHFLILLRQGRPKPKTENAVVIGRSSRRG